MIGDQEEDQQKGTPSVDNTSSVLGKISAISRLVGNLPKCPIIVVERGQLSVSPRRDAMYLLLEPGELSPLKEGSLNEFDRLQLLAPGAWSIDPPECNYSERVYSDSNGQFIGIHREYSNGSSTTRTTLTASIKLASLWAKSQTPDAAQQAVQKYIDRAVRAIRFERSSDCFVSARVFAKRLFDIAFSVIALLLSAPLFPIAMLAIWLEDGRPFFFVHRRQSQGGREFGCIKFRVMRRDAEELKEALQQENHSDGPQFYLPEDPRLLKVGRVLRRWNVDELPQFYNVLRGDMSIVGPRPSPESENQYCPTWREARLSVRPGVTGLWQVCRTRQPQVDFQEWVRFDLDYIERKSWWLDLWIIIRTPLAILGRPASIT